MRHAIQLALAIVLITGLAACRSNRGVAANCYRGRLDKKALCSNYTLTVLGPIDTALVNARWTNETTGQQYSNAFGLSNPCSFPAAINEGDKFYFTIVTKTAEPCATCMAYYPTPPRKLAIRVIPGPCK